MFVKLRFVDQTEDFVGMEFNAIDWFKTNPKYDSSKKYLVQYNGEWGNFIVYEITEEIKNT